MYLGGILFSTTGSIKTAISTNLQLSVTPGVAERHSPGLATQSRFRNNSKFPPATWLSPCDSNNLKVWLPSEKQSYEAGKRSGSWIKYRVNRGQEFVVGGDLPGPHGFDSLTVGYDRGKDLVYVARVRNGFVPALRRKVFAKIRGIGFVPDAIRQSAG